MALGKLQPRQLINARQRTLGLPALQTIGLSWKDGMSFPSVHVLVMTDVGSTRNEDLQA